MTIQVDIRQRCEHQALICQACFVVTNCAQCLPRLVEQDYATYDLAAALGRVTTDRSGWTAHKGCRSEYRETW